jgi:hypothetical protein
LRSPSTKSSRARTWWLGGALALAGGCGGPSLAKDSAALRLEIGNDPSDFAARAQLARRAYAEGRPGEALRELLFVEERNGLLERDRSLLATLLVRRGEGRLALGDAGALADFRFSKSLGGLVDTKSLSNSYAVCAATALRHSSEFRHAEAKPCLALLDESHVFRRWDDLTGLSLAELESLWSWFYSAGAKRRALTVAQAYVDIGGRDASRLAQWRQLHRWWFGDTRPLLPVSAANLASGATTVLSRFVASSAQEFATGVSAPETLASDWGVPDWKASAGEIIRGYQDDPALADRRARRFADTNAYGAREAAFLCELFHRLGDPGRARDWAEELVERAPMVPAALEAAGHAHAASGQPERAGVFYTASASASGDGGATWARAARALLAGGHPLAAVGAGRRAIGLTAQGWDMLLLFEVAMAQRKIGRDDQSAKTLGGLWTRFPAGERGKARELAVENENGPGSSKTLLGPIRAQLGFTESFTAK